MAWIICKNNECIKTYFLRMVPENVETLKVGSGTIQVGQCDEVELEYHDDKPVCLCGSKMKFW